MALAERVGLAGLVAEHVSVPGSPGANAVGKVAAVVAGMVAGADSFEDLAVLRHGAMRRLLAGAPAVAGVRLRKGNVASAHGAPKLIADAVATARRCGAGELVTVRADSAYYQRPVVAAARAAGARFSITARMNPQITKAIAGIDDQAWTAIKYPKAVFDELAGGWVSDAAVAEVPVFTAFTSRPKAQQVTARLIVR